MSQSRGHSCPGSWCLHRRRRLHEDPCHQHHPSVFLGTAPDPQCTAGSSSPRLAHTGPITSHHQAGPLQLASYWYYTISARPTSDRAKCRRSTCLLTSDVRAHDSTASAAALATHSGANSVPAVCSGIPLCAQHSTDVICRLTVCG